MKHLSNGDLKLTVDHKINYTDNYIRVAKNEKCNMQKQFDKNLSSHVEYSKYSSLVIDALYLERPTTHVTGKKQKTDVFLVQAVMRDETPVTWEYVKGAINEVTEPCNDELEDLKSLDAPKLNKTLKTLKELDESENETVIIIMII